MKKVLSHITLLLLLSFPVKMAVGQYTGATAKLDQDTMMIGDRNNLELTVTVPAGSFVHWPLLMDTLTRFIEIHRRSVIDTVATDKDRYTIRQSLSITSFDSGSYVIPPILFKYSIKGDSLTYFTETLPVRLEVSSPEINPEEDIMPIKPPLKAPVTFREMLPWIGLAMLALVLAFLAYYFLFRKKKKPPVVTTRLKPSIPPYEAALEAFEALRQKKLWQAGRVKDYYSELTDIVREYIELRFPVRALEMTTSEIEAALRQTEANSMAREKLHQTLLLADLVKFAKVQPLPLENDVSLNHCVDFVRETKQHKDEVRGDSGVNNDVKQSKIV